MVRSVLKKISKEQNIIKKNNFKLLYPQYYYTMHKLILLAGWQSGYAAACKAVYAGSIPASASIIFEQTYKFKKYNTCYNGIY